MPIDTNQDDAIGYYDYVLRGPIPFSQTVLDASGIKNTVMMA